MAEIKTETVINADVKTIWKKLLDFNDYPKWNPLITKAVGLPYLGSVVTITLQGPMGAGIDLDVKITEKEENKRFHWVGSFPILNFLMTGDHYFIFENAGRGKTRFIHGEKFTGLLAPFLAPIIESQGQPQYEALNQALKTECEKN